MYLHDIGKVIETKFSVPEAEIYIDMIPEYSSTESKGYVVVRSNGMGSGMAYSGKETLGVDILVLRGGPTAIDKSRDLAHNIYNHFKNNSIKIGNGECKLGITMGTGSPEGFQMKNNLTEYLLSIKIELIN